MGFTEPAVVGAEPLYYRIVERILGFGTSAFDIRFLSGQRFTGPRRSFAVIRNRNSGNVGPEVSVNDSTLGASLQRLVADNEIFYGSVIHLDTESFTVSASPVSGYTRIGFPALSWASGQPSNTSVGRGVLLYQGVNRNDAAIGGYRLNPAWVLEQDVQTNNAGEVRSAAGDLYIDVRTGGPSVVVTNRALDEIGNLFVSASGTNDRQPYFALHSGIPSQGNRITVSGQAISTSNVEGNWSQSTVSGYHRWTYDKPIVFASALPADTNEEPTHMGCWTTNNQLLWYVPLNAIGTTSVGDAVTIPSGELYLEIELG